MMVSFRTTLIAGIALAPLVAGAQEVQDGPSLPFGGGTVHAFAETDAGGRATRIGVALSEEAVGSLGQEMVFLTVPLPEAARAAGYDHVSLDWMPHGHEPAGMFDRPHFDVHFYMTTEAERLAIDPSDPHFGEKAAHRPDAAFLPANYMPPPQVEPIPAMGEHWLDVTDPIFQGQPFEAVLIYGAWDGKVTFVEPMVTRDLLTSRREFGGEVGQPEQVATDIALPSAWSVSFDTAEGAHIVSLDALELRRPGDGRSEEHAGLTR